MKIIDRSHEIPIIRLAYTPVERIAVISVSFSINITLVAVVWIADSKTPFSPIPSEYHQSHRGS